MRIFETERLVARPLVKSDISALAKILSDPEVMRYSIRGVCDESATAKFIGWCQSCYDDYGVGPWALVNKTDSELVGFCGVSPEEVGGVVEMSLGYRLAQRHWNRGLATEAARAAIEYVFSAGISESIVAIIQADHSASLKVAEKSGFRESIETNFHERIVRIFRLNRFQWSE